MATARYRVADSKGAYMALDPHPQLLQLGADHSAAAVYGIRAPVFTLLRQGAEIDFSGIPGPHLEPINDEAREATARYWEMNPNATLDPTRRMPLGQDPMGGRSIEQLVGGLLDAMDRDAAAAATRPAAGADMTVLLAAVTAMAEAQAAMAASQAVIQQALAALLTAQAPPAATGRAK